MARSFRVLALASCLVLMVPGGLAADKPWAEIRSPHFRVLTNGSTQDALKVAHEFEELRWVFATRFPGARLESGAPFLVLAVRDYGTAKSLDPQLRRGGGENVAGLFYHGQEKQYAMVRLDTFGGNGAKEVVYHEYARPVEGKINSVVCGDKDEDWTFVIDQGSHPLIFHRKGGFVIGFSDTIWYGGDHFNVCHHLEGRRAVVHYRPPADTTYAGDVAEIEIRDDLPVPFTGATQPSKP